MSQGMGGVLFLISAPSGAGKTTVCRNLLESESHLVRVVTCTTRSPREGEVDGQDYFFFSPEGFQERVRAGEFLETAQVYGHSYGTLKREVMRGLEAGNDVLLNIDVQGAALVRKTAQEDPQLAQALVTVFLTPPTMEELERRLRNRASDTDSVIEQRLQAAAQELASSQNFDYLVLSDSMEEDHRRMRVILEAEKLKRFRNPLPESLDVESRLVGGTCA